MNVSTFQSLIIGLLCVSVSGMGALIYRGHYQLAELRQRPVMAMEDLASRSEVVRLKHAQDRLQQSFEALRQTVSAPPATPTADPRLAQLAAALNELRDQLAGLAPQHLVQAQAVRVDQLEKQLAALKQPVWQSLPSRPARPAAKPRVSPTSVPVPFTLLGIETRGDERFLSIAPLGTDSLDEIRLLYPGERFGAWQLTALEPTTARFAVEGRPPQSLVLP